MKNENDLNFYKNFLDLIPEPIIIIKEKILKFFFANIEFQVHFEKSLTQIKNASIEKFLAKNPSS